MFVYKIKSTLSNQTYLCGISTVLNQLLENNPKWSYLLINKTQTVLNGPHLTLIDLTGYQSIREITEESRKLIQKKKGYKILVLLDSDQTALACTLQQFYSCSLLCVDEMHFHIRDVIESSLRKRRYRSAMIKKMIAKHTQQSKDVHFTPTEMRILSELHSGKKGAELSCELFRSQKTISSHKRRIMKKLGAKDDLSLKLILEGVDYINNPHQV
ncbi:helix-turn-helix domain-containing protein [Enterobacter dykesii]|uniref:helix-turn-helix domain-containing protein n=1 Tax=Enterobacter dykesii TaxID=2797506 RepID=UPI0032B4FA0F